MKTYIVQRGDSLWLISKKYGISPESLIAANPQIANPDIIDVGMLINIPANATGGLANVILPSPSIQQSDPAPQTEILPSGTTTYTVVQGDTLWAIAKRYGITLEALIAANQQIANPDMIDVGMTINIPSSGSPMPYTITQSKKGKKTTLPPTLSPTLPPTFAPPSLPIIEEICPPQLEELPELPELEEMPELPKIPPLPSFKHPHLPKEHPVIPIIPKKVMPKPPMMPTTHPTHAPQPLPTVSPIQPCPPALPIFYPQYHFPNKITVHHIHHICGCCTNKIRPY